MSKPRLLTRGELRKIFEADTSPTIDWQSRIVPPGSVLLRVDRTQGGVVSVENAGQTIPECRKTAWLFFVVPLQLWDELQETDAKGPTE